jgi:succinate dehydrogenase / fumarate reductase flavoprotein subunit
MKPSVLVIGAGASGSMAVLGALQAGAEVTLISRTWPVRSNSASSGEGLGVSILGRGDCAQAFIDDVMRASVNPVDHNFVKRMCESSEAVLGFLVRIGVPFDRTCEGALKGFETFGASFPRLYRRSTITGNLVMRALTGQLLRESSLGRANLFFGWEFLSPIIDENGMARGAVAVNCRNMEIRAFRADAIIIASGGYPSIYEKSSGSILSDGSAIVACYKRGASIANPEAVSVSPFGIRVASRMSCVSDAFICGNARPFLAEGSDRNYFLEGKSPSELNHSTICRIIDGAGVDKKHANVGIDISGADLSMLDKYFERDVSALLSSAGAKSIDEPILVHSCVKGSLGGLLVDENHAVNLPGLFAAGDAAAAGYGGCSMEGISLLSSLYGGHVAAKSAVRYAQGSVRALGDAGKSLFDKAVEAQEDENARIASRDGGKNPRMLSKKLAMFMQDAFLSNSSAKKSAELREKFFILKDEILGAALLSRSEWANAELIFVRRLAGRLELCEIILDAVRRRATKDGAESSDDLEIAECSKVVVVNHAEGGARFDFSERL